MDLIYSITDSITILNVFALFLTATCLMFFLLESIVGQLGHGRLEPGARFRLSNQRFIHQRILQLFEVGGLISLPKRSLSGQRIG